MTAKDRFSLSSMSFADSPLAEGKILLREVLPLANLGPELGDLPEPLRAIVGKPIAEKGLSVDIFGRHLRDSSISEAEVGGSLEEPLSSVRTSEGDLVAAKYFVIHDTSSPVFDSPFPATINDADSSVNKLSGHLGPDAVAHLFINRAGQSALGHDYRTGFRATKFETKVFGVAVRGLFLHNEMIQPRRPGAHTGDEIAPTPGFTRPQYSRLALAYLAASVRRGTFLIPASHGVLDEGIPNGHDDPQHFVLADWAAAIDLILEHIREEQGVVVPG